MYKIYVANFSGCDKKIGKRPCVIVGGDRTHVYAYKITSRMRDDFRHVRMNNYLINGFCDMSTCYRIKRKNLGKMIRSCTTSEMTAMDNYTLNARRVNEK